MNSVLASSTRYPLNCAVLCASARPARKAVLLTYQCIGLAWVHWHQTPQVDIKDNRILQEARSVLPNCLTWSPCSLVGCDTHYRHTERCHWARIVDSRTWNSLPLAGPGLFSKELQALLMSLYTDLQTRFWWKVHLCCSAFLHVDRYSACYAGSSLQGPASLQTSFFRAKY